MVLLLDFHGSAHAQLVTGDLQISVVDSLGDPVPGVNAVVTGPSVQGVRGGVTNDLGLCTVLALSPGKVSVRLSHTAYHPAVFENVLIQLGKTTSLGKIRLVQWTVDLPELVISGEQLNIDPRTTTYGSNLRPSEFENLPIDRDYKSMISVLPQSNVSYYGDGVNMGGGTGLENKYFVDGVDVTQSLTGNTGTNLPYNFIKEIEVRTGGYEAEYRSSLGGIINVVTYSGSNEVHGSAFGFYTSNRFAAERRVGLLDPTQGGFSEYDIGISMGGPIVRDALWYYVAYNPTFTHHDVDVPSFGVYVDKNTTNAFAGKLSWRASDRLQLVVTTTGDPGRRTAVGDGVGIPPSVLKNPDPYFMDQMSGGINLSIIGTYSYNDALLFETTLSRVTRKESTRPSTERGSNDVLFNDTETNTWSGGVEWRANSFLSVNSLDVSTTLFAGSHRLKAGLAYKDMALDQTADNHYLSRTNDTSYFEWHYNQEGVGVHNRIPSVFVQDSWQVFRDLNIHFGVRLDEQFLIGSNGMVDQQITGPIQPRVGFAFLPDGDGSQKLFGSFGRYIQELGTLFALLNYTDIGYYYGVSYDHDPRVNPSGGHIDQNGKYRIEPAIDGLRAQYYDDFSLGYERFVTKELRVSVQGVYRTLREAIEDMWVPEELRYKSGNPGRGDFSAYPRPQRDYTAMTVTVERRDDDQFNFIASYVLSRIYGNYGGLFDAVTHYSGANVTAAFNDLNSASEHATGLLPNDRTHVFKLSGSYRFPHGLAAGISFIAQSGTPLSEYADLANGFNNIKFLSPRGSIGRTPPIWDLNARVIYVLPLPGLLHARLLLDIFHIASQRDPVDVSQARGFMVSNGTLYPYATYGQAYRYQPPMSVRLGMEASF
jgi:hypothetical protein